MSERSTSSRFVDGESRSETTEPCRARLNANRSRCAAIRQKSPDPARPVPRSLRAWSRTRLARSLLRALLTHQRRLHQRLSRETVRLIAFALALRAYGDRARVPPGSMPPPEHDGQPATSSSPLQTLHDPEGSRVHRRSDRPQLLPPAASATSAKASSIPLPHCATSRRSHAAAARWRCGSACNQRRKVRRSPCAPHLRTEPAVDGSCPSGVKHWRDLTAQILVRRLPQARRRACPATSKEQPRSRCGRTSPGVTIRS